MASGLGVRDAVPTGWDAVIKSKIKMHAVILSCAYYNMGFWRFCGLAILNATGVDSNGHEWTGVDKIPGSLCLTGLAKKKPQAPNPNPGGWQPPARSDRR